MDMAIKVKRVIHDDIVTEIVKRFRPKPLAKFLCVSKNWRSMILDEISRRNSKEDKVVTVSVSSVHLVDFTNPNKINETTLLEFPVEDTFYTVGYANGLVSYIDRENKAFVLFNPWTKERRIIQISDNIPNHVTPEYYAFGFTWTSETQKWISISTSLDPVTWKPIYDLPSPVLAIYVNGCIYWQIKSGILCFNLKTFKFNVIKEPPRHKGIRHLDLIVLGDSLAAVELVMYPRSVRGCTHVWELSGEMQWMKIMTVPRFDASSVSAAEYQADGAFYELLSPVLRLKSGLNILLSRAISRKTNTMTRGVLINRGLHWLRFAAYIRGRKVFTRRLKTRGIIKLSSTVIVSYKNNLFHGRHQQLE